MAAHDHVIGHAGNDLGDFMQALPRDGEDIPVWRLLRALVACPVPLVAAVHGNCVGIGTTMLLHCDLVVADVDADLPDPRLPPLSEAEGDLRSRSYPVVITTVSEDGVVRELDDATSDVALARHSK